MSRKHKLNSIKAVNAIRHHRGAETVWGSQENYPEFAVGSNLAWLMLFFVFLLSPARIT